MTICWKKVARFYQQLPKRSHNSYHLKCGTRFRLLCIPHQFRVRKSSISRCSIKRCYCEWTFNCSFFLLSLDDAVLSIMISKTLSTFAVVAFIAFVTVDVDATPKSSVDVNQLRSMAASSGVSSRSKRASYGIMPGHLRYEEVNQKRLVNFWL